MACSGVSVLLLQESDSILGAAGLDELKTFICRQQGSSIAYGPEYGVTVRGP
jgi:hypothetical protein